MGERFKTQENKPQFHNNQRPTARIETNNNNNTQKRAATALMSKYVRNKIQLSIQIM